MWKPDTNAKWFPIPTTTQIAKWIDLLPLKTYLSPQVSISAHFGVTVYDKHTSDLIHHQMQLNRFNDSRPPIIMEVCLRFWSYSADKQKD